MEPTGYALTDDGIQLPWYSNGKGPDVFIFNGFACVQDNLKYVIETLKSNFRVVSWDYRGHGATDRTAGTEPQKATLEWFMKDAIGVFKAAGLKKAHLLGYSMGAQFGMEFTLRHPEKVKSIVGLNGIYGHVFDNIGGSDFVSRLLQQLKFEEPFVNDAYNRLWKAALGVPFEIKYNIAAIAMVDRGLTNPEEFRPYLEQLQNLEGHFMLALMQEIHQHETYSYLGKIEQPALIVAGDKDPIATAEMAKRVVDLLPNSASHIIKGGTHNSNLERPEEIFPAIIKFLQECEKGKLGKLLKNRLPALIKELL